MSASARDDIFLFVEAKRQLDVDSEACTWYDELMEIRKILDTLVKESDLNE